MNWFKKLWGKWFKIQHLERIYIGLPYCPIHLSLSIKYLKWKWKSWFLANVFISANHKSAVISWQNLLLESKLMKIFLLMKTLLKCWFYSDFDLASQFFFSTNLHIFTKPTRPSQIADKMGKKSSLYISVKLTSCKIYNNFFWSHSCEMSLPPILAMLHHKIPMLCTF